MCNDWGGGAQVITIISPAPRIYIKVTSGWVITRLNAAFVAEVTPHRQFIDNGMIYMKFYSFSIYTLIYILKYPKHNIYRKKR